MTEAEADGLPERDGTGQEGELASEARSWEPPAWPSDERPSPPFEGVKSAYGWRGARARARLSMALLGVGAARN